MSETNFPSISAQRIDSWKAIAAYFDRDERTVKRWESTRGLPVRRLPGTRGRVFAYVAELDLWMNGQTTAKIAGLAGEYSSDADEFSAIPSVPNLEFSVPDTARTEQGFYGFSRLAIGSIFFVLLSGLLLANYAKNRLALKKVIATPAQTNLLVGPPSQPEELYLNGKYYWNQRTTHGLDQAVAFFQQALIADPSYAKGYAGLASAYDLMPEYGSLSPKEAFPRAIDAASKAIQLDASLAEAHRALAFAQFYGKWDVRDATAEFERAIKLAPGDTDAHHWYATTLLTIGQINAATEQIEQARRLDPTSRSVLVDRAFIELKTRNRLRGLSELQALEKSEPQFVSVHRFLASEYLETGHYLDSLNELELTGQFSGMQEEKEIAVAARNGWRHSGSTGMLECMLSVYKEYFKQGKDSGYNVAKIDVLLGNKLESVTYLEAAFHARDYMVMTVASGNFAPLLGDYPPYRRLQLAVQKSISPGVGGVTVPEENRQPGLLETAFSQPASRPAER
jgi:tetratricopeptide (TPR) repeat protein